ncbi:hypothetical protein [Bdellovibrio sp. HCB274]|uniref:hypothetical protein n=1 Tax=Bdellovibrio sp. HCB274 TaxID=3394361 RepID=UPI0039B37DED
MSKIVFALAISLLSSVSFASDVNHCIKFVGKYSRQIDNNDTFGSQGLKISVDPSATSLVLTFNSDTDPSQWRGWIESYIADGLVHAGDANTGKTYVATCSSDGIAIKREGLLIKPLVTQITVSGDQLYYLSFAEGSESRATFMKLKKIQ